MDDEQRREMSRQMYGDTFGGLQRRVGAALAQAGEDERGRLEKLASELQHLAGVLYLVRGRLTELERRLDAEPG